MPSSSEETKPLTSDRRSSFSFGTEETEQVAPTGGFSFGSALPSSTTAEPTTQSGFSFGPSPTTTTTETGEFSFGGSTTTFSFGASEPEPSFSLAAATQPTEAINNSSGSSSSNAVNTESSSEPFPTGGGLFGLAHTGDTDGANTTFGATSSSSTFGVPSLGGSSNPFVAPRFGSSGFATSSEDETHNDLQRKVISLWQQILGSENITSETDFFEAGGTSMSSISMLSRLGTELGVDLRPFLLRENRTVSKLVKYIEEAKRTGFGGTSSNTGFGASSSATNNTPSFGTNSGTSGFGAPRSTGFGSLSFGTNVGTTGFGTAPSSTTTTGFGGFGATSSGTGTTTTSFGFGFGSTTPAEPFGASQPERPSNSTSVFAPVSLQAFLNNDKADLCLKYGSDQQFLVHSSLMRLMSPIIGEMIDKQKVETIVEGRLVLDIDLKSLYLYKGELEGVLQPERLFKELIENMHGQEVKFNSTSSVTMANIINYYVIASKFGVSTVVNNIRPQIKEKLATVKSDEFEEIVSSAVKNEQEELLWMLNELDEQKCILKVPEWRSVSQEFLLKFIGSDQLRVDNESSVWICVKDWLEGKQLHVMVDEQKVKECVRFPYIAQKDLVQHVKPLSWLTESEYYACLEYRAIDDNNLGDEMKNLISSKFSESMNFKPRDCQKRIDMDVLIVCDTTGSMAGEISVAQATIKNIMSDLKRRCNGTIRFSLIAYKDYCDGPNIIKCHEFTESLTAAKAYVDTMGASGGGDHPEAVALALHHATQAEFRSNAKKYCIIIADAPPHGMGEPGDSMPNGEEHDWLECADKLNQMDVVCYACICGRARDNGNLSLFMDTVARKTTGRCILLQNAEKIPDIIINGTNEDFEIEEVVSDYLKELGDSVKEMSQEDLNTKIQSHFKEKKVQVNTLHVVNCFNSNTQSLASHSKLTSEARSLFGSGTTTVQPSSTAAGFSFGSSSFGAPSESHVSSIASRVTKTYMK